MSYILKITMYPEELPCEKFLNLKLIDQQCVMTFESKPLDNLGEAIGAVMDILIALDEDMIDDTFTIPFAQINQSLRDRCTPEMLEDFLTHEEEKEYSFEPLTEEDQELMVYWFSTDKQLEINKEDDSGLIPELSLMSGRISVIESPENDGPTIH